MPNGMSSKAMSTNSFQTADICLIYPRVAGGTIGEMAIGNGRIAVLGPILDALKMAGFMTWEILWALVLGFFVSAGIQAVVSHSEMAKLLPDDEPRTIAK